MPAITPNEYEALVQQTRAWSIEYYVLDTPTVSDAVYDAAYQQIKEFEADPAGYTNPSSPTQSVIGDLQQSNFTKVAHTVPMLSIDNAMNESEALAFYRSTVNPSNPAATPVQCAELKFDGLALTLHYRLGHLTQAITRGDSTHGIGEDVTLQALTLHQVPHYVPAFASIPLQEVRGEALMHKADLDSYNQHLVAAGQKPLMNTRQAAAGGMRQKDPKKTAERNLRFYAYNILNPERFNLSSHSEAQAFLTSCGFSISPLTTLVHSFQDLQNFFTLVEQSRPSIPFDIDGVVFKVDSYAEQNRLGWISKTPKWAIAYKFIAEEQETTLLGIDIQIGRTGQAAPVARLQPVFVAGTVISNATLHNFSEIARLDIRIGDTVLVKRAGEVIPRVESVVFEKRPANSTPTEVPTHCPECGSSLEYEQLQDGKIGANLFCTGGLACPPQRLNAIAHFGSRSAMNIANFGDSTVQAFHDAGFLNTLSDIIRIPQHQAALAALPGFGKSSVSKLVKAIEALQDPANTTLSRFIYALGISQVGSNTSKNLADTFGSWDALLNATYDEILAIPDIGPATATSVYNTLRRKDFISEVNAILTYVKLPSFVAAPTSQQLAGLNFVITGTLSTERGHFKTLIENAGGKVSSSVSKKVTHLLAGDNAGTKIDDAKKIPSITILSEANFNNLLNPS